MEKILVERGRVQVAAHLIEGRVLLFHPGFDLLHKLIQVDQLCQFLAGMDDQQVGHARLHLSQFVQQDTKDTLLFAREIDPVIRALLHPQASDFNIEYQVRPIRYGIVWTASLRAGIGFVGHSQTSVVEQAVGDLKLPAQVENALWLASHAQFLADLIAVGLDEDGEARGRLHPLVKFAGKQVRLPFKQIGDQISLFRHPSIIKEANPLNANQGVQRVRIQD